MVGEKIRIGLFSDLHVGKINGDESFTSLSEWRAIANGLADQVDIALLAGDITERGSSLQIAEAGKALEPLSRHRNMIAVTGNHDGNTNSGDASSNGISILENQASIVEINGRKLGIIGMNGYLGSNDDTRIKSIQNQDAKRLAYHAATERRYLKQFQANLSRLEKDKIPSIVLMHYSPIEETTGSNPSPDILSPKFAEAIAASSVVFAVVHGHYHGSVISPRGNLEGSIAGQNERNIPVYNVAAPLLRRSNREPYKIITV